MGEHKTKTSSKSAKSTRTKTPASSSSKSHTTALRQDRAMASNARVIRCPGDTLKRIRGLNEAEVITLFTPLVPHPPSTTLALDMDPFEPLGRALPRHVRHVPYRLDKGMTELHADFLPASGAVVIVICVTDTIMSRNHQAFNQQVNFARDVTRTASKHGSIAGIPIIMLLASSDAAGQAYADAVPEFPAIIGIDDYTTGSLANAVRVLFDQ